MATRNRIRSNRGGRQQRVSSQFGELDTTPTSRYLQSPRQQADNHSSLRKPRKFHQNTWRPLNSSRALTDEFENSLGDDMLQLDTMTTPPDGDQTQPYSEPRSQGRCSSPTVGDTPKDIWEFGAGIDDGSSLPPFSSPKYGLDKLPDTVPIPPEHNPDTQHPVATDSRSRLDLSETASTMRRSSPFELEAAGSTIWDLLGDTPGKQPSDDGFQDRRQQNTMKSCPQPEAPFTLPTDNTHETTLTKQSSNHSITQNTPYLDAVREIRDSFEDSLVMESPAVDLQGALEQSDDEARRRLDFESEKDFVDSPPRSTESVAAHNEASSDYPAASSCDTPDVSDTHASHLISTPQTQQRGKKRKQRAKTPIQFDENTQVVEEESQVKRKAPRIAAATTTTKAPASTVPATISAKRAAAKRTSRPKKKRKTNAPKQSPKELMTNSAQSGKVPKRAPPRTRGQARFAKRDFSSKAQPDSIPPEGHHNVAEEGAIPEANHATSDPGHPGRASPVPTQNGKIEGEPQIAVTDSIVIPSDSRSNVSTGSLCRQGSSGPSSPRTNPSTTAFNLEKEVEVTPAKPDVHDENSTADQRGIPDSYSTDGSVQKEYETGGQGWSAAKKQTGRLSITESSRPRLAEQGNTQMLPQDPNVQANREEIKAINGTADVPVASSKMGRVLRPRTSVAEQHVLKETKPPQDEKASRQPRFKRRASYDEKRGGEASSRPGSGGQQRAKDSEAKRTLSISEAGSPVRLQRTQSGELVSPLQAGNQESSDSGEKNASLAQEVGRPRRRKVRRQLVFTDSRRSAEISRPHASMSTREVDEISLRPGEPKGAGSMTNRNDFIEQFRIEHRTSQIADIRNRVRTQISAGFHEQQQAEEMSVQGDGLNGHKTDSKGGQPSSLYGNVSGISRELHSIVDVSTASFRACW